MLIIVIKHDLYQSCSNSIRKFISELMIDFCWQQIICQYWPFYNDSSILLSQLQNEDCRARFSELIVCYRRLFFPFEFTSRFVALVYSDGLAWPYLWTANLDSCGKMDLKLLLRNKDFTSDYYFLFVSLLTLMFS